jgi:hypothetical protein
VAHLNPNIPFVGGLGISNDFSNAGLFVGVAVDSNSGLNLGLFNQNPSAGILSISASGGTFNPTSPTTPNGEEIMSFTSGVNSTVSYEGFGTVNLL